MGDVGWFLPLLIVFCVGVSLLLGLIERIIEPKSSYQKWLEEKLKEDPDYINWLKVTNNGRDYKLGKKILARVKRNESSAYKKWFKRMRKIGKY